MKIKDSPQVTSCWLFLNNLNKKKNNSLISSRRTVKNPKVWGGDNEAWLFQHKTEIEHNLQCKGPKSLISKQA